MRDISGISGAGPIYHLFMRAVRRGAAPRDFSEPPGLRRLEVCRLSGLLPTEHCRGRVTELFIAGTEPRHLDRFQQPFTIDRATGLLADESTPAADRLQQVFLVLPPEARDWARRHGIPQPPVAAGELAFALGGSLRWLSPDPYTVFQFADHLPAAAQRLRLALAAPAATRAVEFRLNGETIALVESAPWETWWILRPGEYSLRASATLPDGDKVESAPLPFSVAEAEARASYERGR